MFDSENEKFTKDPRAYIQKRAICPPDNITGDVHRGETATQFDTSGFGPTHTTFNTQPISIRNARVMQNMKVAYSRPPLQDLRLLMMMLIRVKTHLPGRSVARSGSSISMPFWRTTPSCASMATPTASRPVWLSRRRISLRSQV